MQVPGDFYLGLDVSFEDIALDESVGRGQFGEVFRAHIEGKRVAVKQIFIHGTAEERLELIEDFSKECKVMSMTRHPNIVRFYGAVRQSPNFCLITELCEGNLQDLLTMVSNKKVNVTWRLLWSIANGAAQALRYLHFETETQIIHRDVKAENMLLNKAFVCKLTDFGLSRIIDSGKNNQMKNMTMCGTPSWIAPEIFKGEAYNQRIDVYSYAIVLWELFCFQKPYANSDPVKLPYQVALESKRPPLAPHIPQKFANLMDRCWHGDPEQRPEFTEICDTLASFLKGDTLNIDLDSPVDVTAISNDLYKMKSAALRLGSNINIPGAITEDSGEF